MSILITDENAIVSGTGSSNQVKWKEPVLVATTANITLSGEQTIDGVLTKTLTATQSIAIMPTSAGWVVV